MHFLLNFYKKRITYDLLNKFYYKNTKKIPKLKKIILNFECKTTEMISIAICLLAIEIITHQKGTLIKTKRPHILLKIRKGQPIGCKVILREIKMIHYFSKILTEFFPNLQNFYGFKLIKKLNSNFFSYIIKETASLNELENHYYLFYKLPKLKITIITNTSSAKEFAFFLNSFKFPLKK